MTKPELGTKRACAGCNARFYDLHKTPIVCPTCQAIYVIVKPPPPRNRRPVEPMPVTIAPSSPTDAIAGDDIIDNDEAVEEVVDDEVDAVIEKVDDEDDGIADGVPLLEEADEDER